MARTRTNAITKDYSGIFDNALMTSDGTLRSRPDVSKRVWSPKQKAHLERVERAKEFGRMAISDPVLNEHYARMAENKHGLGAWHVAISDCYKLPVIETVDLRDFMKLHEIRQISCSVNKTDLKEVRIYLFSPVGELLEEGPAKQLFSSGDWHYELIKHIEPVHGLTVTIRAEDIPGNMTNVTVVYPFDCLKPLQFGTDPIVASKGKRKKSQLRTRGN